MSVQRNAIFSSSSSLLLISKFEGHSSHFRRVCAWCMSVCGAKTLSGMRGVLSFPKDLYRKENKIAHLYFVLLFTKRNVGSLPAVGRAKRIGIATIGVISGLGDGKVLERNPNSDPGENSTRSLVSPGNHRRWAEIVFHRSGEHKTQKGNYASDTVRAKTANLQISQRKLLQNHHVQFPPRNWFEFNSLHARVFLY